MVPQAGDYVGAASARGVNFRICQFTLTRRNADLRKVTPQAVLVPSGVAEISRLQAQEGYAYLRP